MYYDQIEWAVLGVLRHCGVKSFPVDCVSLLSFYKLKCKTYQEQSPKKLQKCFKISDDAFMTKNTVFYNNEMPCGRIRFSLMHELGHICLEHGEAPSEEQEDEADFFASRILAPRMAIHYSGCKNQIDIVKQFQTSQEAAQYAFNDYRRWYRRTVYHKMSAFDKAMYVHFYNEDAKRFVYSIKNCEHCGAKVYNSYNVLCTKCKAKISNRLLYRAPAEDFLIAESQWLYGGL